MKEWKRNEKNVHVIGATFCNHPIVLQITKEMKQWPLSLSPVLFRALIFSTSMASLDQRVLVWKVTSMTAVQYVSVAVTQSHLHLGTQTGGRLFLVKETVLPIINNIVDCDPGEWVEDADSIQLIISELADPTDKEKIDSLNITRRIERTMI